MDGTLADTLPVVYRALQETFIRFAGKKYSEAEIAGMFGPTEEGLIRPRVAEADFTAALAHYLGRYAALHEAARMPFPGVFELLELLERRGIHRAIVTGKGQGTARISMQAMGLDRHIEYLVTGSHHGAEKPAAIRQLLAGWSLCPEQAAYVGDMPYDMQAAREAGVFALGAAWASTATVKEGNGAEHIFYAVDELARWVEATG
jgi:pyrophosphatase PpaX